VEVIAMTKKIRLKPLNVIVVLLMTIVGLAINNIWDRQALEDCMQRAVISEKDLPVVVPAMSMPIPASVVVVPVRRRRKAKRKSNKVGVVLPVAGGGLFGRLIW
jgi:hypothetical protein